MKYFLYKNGNTLDSFNDSAWYRESPVFPKFSWTSPDLTLLDYVSSPDWEEISEKEAKLLIVKWRMES